MKAFQFYLQQKMLIQRSKSNPYYRGIDKLKASLEVKSTTKMAS